VVGHGGRGDTARGGRRLMLLHAGPAPGLRGGAWVSHTLRGRRGVPAPLHGGKGVGGGGAGSSHGLGGAGRGSHLHVALRGNCGRVRLAVEDVSVMHVLLLLLLRQGGLSRRRLLVQLSCSPSSSD
jgi:hypothetical protein